MPASIRSLLVAFFAASVSLPVLAVLPDSGLWSIDSELNGKPGRGIQIDRQGAQTLIVTYFGYRTDGTATFFQAVGEVVDGKTFKANLVEYKNGKALGGAMHDGEVAQVIGSVTMDFDSATTGSITLPGEDAQAFSRFSFESEIIKKRLNHSYYVMAFRSGNQVPSQLAIEATGDKLTISEYQGRISSSSAEKTCTYTGQLRATGASFASDGKLQCVHSGPYIFTSYKIRNLSVDEFGTLRGTFFRYGRSAESTEDILVNYGPVAGQAFSDVVMTSPFPELVNTADDMGWEEVWQPFSH